MKPAPFPLTALRVAVPALLACALVSSCPTTAEGTRAAVPTVPAVPAVPVYGYRVVRTYPHDPFAFTQGLVYEGGLLYEGTGLTGRSQVRRVELETGKVLQQRSLSPELFGEGLTLFGDRLIQITWTTRKGFVYDKKSLEPQREFSYPTEGWGITHDGRRLIMSDGSSSLFFLDPKTFARLGSVTVTAPDGPVARLNELEYVGGEVYANVWQTDRIARINPKTGKVTGWIDLGGLLPKNASPFEVDVLNGIAFDSQKNRLFVTGKLWPSLFEIKLVERK